MHVLKKISIITVILFVGIGAWTITKNRNQANAYAQTNTGTGTNTILREQDGLQFTFSKTTALDETYMVFGLRASSKNQPDGFIAGIPLATARSLLQRYPDMGSCGSAGSSQAQNAIQDLLIVGDTRDLQDGMQHAEKSANEALRAAGKRICVRLQGHNLRIDNITHQGQSVEVSGMGTPMHPTRVSVVPCL